MEINLSQLREALDYVKPGLSNKEQIEQSTSFVFKGNHVFTYNGEVGISHPIPGLEFEGVINAETFYKFLAKIPPSNKEEPQVVKATVKEQEVVFSYGRVKSGLTLQTEIVLPLQLVEKKAVWIDLPKDFIKHLGFTMTVCSDNAGEAIYTYVHVNQIGVLEGTDGYRFLQCQLNMELPMKSFLLPAKTAEILIKMIPIQMAEGEGKVHFKTEGGTVISCKISNQSFLNISPLIPKKGIMITLPKTIDKVLDRAMTFAKRDHTYDESISITVVQNRLKVKAECEAGWFEEEVNMPYDGELTSFDIAPYLLKGILSETRGCFLSKDKLKFEGTDWIYVATLKA